ncbi:MAG TPA: hypothetical protein VFX70_01015 [Mycobacteriales bacterium]|nr:hypothetical protein [Mycobacteriales bacterium]
MPSGTGGAVRVDPAGFGPDDRLPLLGDFVAFAAFFAGSRSAAWPPPVDFRASVLFPDLSDLARWAPACGAEPPVPADRSAPPGPDDRVDGADVADRSEFAVPAAAPAGVARFADS